MIKSKSKKVKKYKYSRKEIVKWIRDVVSTEDEDRLVRKLLATQPQPIKEEDNKECKHIMSYQYDEESRFCKCLKCGIVVREYLKQDLDLGKSKYATIIKSTPSLLDEIEEIEEISNTETLDDYQWSERVDIIIDKLIRNQNLIIKQLKQK